MTASLAIYTLATRLLEPAALLLLEQRVKRGKERPDRIRERVGLTQALRPPGPLLWLHGASVGESRLLVDLFAELKRRRPDLHALITTQTLTSADMIAAWAPPGVTHQMAPVDAPGAIRRFLDLWRPDAAVFAEGEIWPNMLAGLRTRGIPAALVNARMTTKTVRGWQNRAPSAREVFSAFGFIGAADDATASGLGAAISRPITIVGNLKRATTVEPPSRDAVASWRRDTGDRPVLLAASTHPGEDEFALDAFARIRRLTPNALLIIAPRHPERGGAIAELVRQCGLASQLRSQDRSAPDRSVDVLVADTIGELVFWYAAADGVYLGGATAPGIGGHNAIEPASLGKRVFTGPHGFNFRETFDALAKAGAIAIGETPADLATWWSSEIARTQAGEIPQMSLAAFFTEAGAPFEATLEAVLAMLPPEGGPHG